MYRSNWIVITAFILTAVFLPVASTAVADEISAETDTLFQSGDRQPASQNKTDYRKYALLAAASGLTFAMDKEINVFSRKPWLHGSRADDFFNGVERLGRSTPYSYAGFILIGHGLIFGNTRSIRAGGELVAGLIAAGSLTSGVKRAFGRKRPYQSRSPFDFFKGGDSFYSGHTITIFTTATILSANYPRQSLRLLGIDRDFPLIPAVSYSIAGLVAVQRLYSDVHWSSDVYFGALAGYGLGRLAVYLGEKIDLNIFSIVPSKEPGLAMVIEF